MVPDIRSRMVHSQLSAVITRADGTVEDLGEISYWHRNPLRRIWWHLRHPRRWRSRLLIGPRASEMLRRRGQTE